MAPPATLTLGTVIDRIRKPHALASIGLGIGQGVLELHHGVWRLIAVHGAVVGVSPHDDRPGERGATLYETRDGEDMIDRLIGELWTSLYGAMLGPGERLTAEVHDVQFRVRLIARVRASLDRELPESAAEAIVDGKRSLDAKQARALSTIVREIGGKIRWTVTQQRATR